jgi:hypothetical protein
MRVLVFLGGIGQVQHGSNQASRLEQLKVIRAKKMGWKKSAHAALFGQRRIIARDHGIGKVPDGP